MYFKEFSCKTAENMQARCVPRFIQCFPNRKRLLQHGLRQFFCLERRTPCERRRREQERAAKPPDGASREAASARARSVGELLARTAAFVGVGYIAGELKAAVCEKAEQIKSAHLARERRASLPPLARRAPRLSQCRQSPFSPQNAANTTTAISAEHKSAHSAKTR